MKVYQKLLLSYIFISLLGCVGGYFGIKAINDIQNRFDGVSNETIPIKNELSNLKSSINNIVIYTNEIIFLEHKIVDHSTSIKRDFIAKNRTEDLLEQIEEWKSDRKDYKSSLDKYEELIRKFFPEEKEYLERIKVSSQEILQISENLINAERKHRDDSTIVAMQSSLSQANEQFDEAINSALQNEDMELEGRKDNLYKTLIGYRRIIFINTALGLFLALAIAYLISRSILKSIDKLQSAALEIGKGNLDARIETSAKDELGLLANTFDRMAEELQQATAYTLNICESLTESLIVLSPDSIIQSVNQSTCDLLGYDSTDLVGQPASILLTDKDSILQNLTLDRLISTGAITNLETTYRESTGSKIPILFSASILTDRKGLTLGIVYLAQDIADLKQMQEKNALLATALENVADAIEITDDTAKYLYVNAAFERITGYTQQEVLGQTPAAILRSGKHSSGFYSEMFDTVAHGQIWNGLQVSKRKDGTLYDQEVTLSPILNTEGLFTHIVAVKRDITERLQAEARLKEAERRWRTLLEEMKLVVVGLNCLGRVDYVNPFFLELSGYSQAEVLGKEWFKNFLPQYQSKQVHKCFLDILMQEFHSNYQNSILTKSGEERVIAWNNTLLHNPQGEVVGTMSIGEDITDRQAIERMKDEFISVVSHELRTPLASIHGGLNLLSSGLMDPQSEKGRRVIQIASDNADRLVFLVNDILELERLESGKIKLAMQPCNMADLIVKATNMMQVMAKRAGITLSVSSQDIQLVVDPDRILQVLTNLLSNAVKFSVKGATVWIALELQRSENRVLFTVQDQGRGIPGDQLDSIFERFHQVDASDSRKKGGTGLGLAICQSIVQQHNGQIWVNSNLGEGSSFCFTLPMTREDRIHDS
jgi:PAS domain S-box-containing protein